MKIVVINLKGSVKRREFQTKQAKHLGLSIEFHQATSIDTITEENFQALRDTWERPMLKKEVCCFLSHKSVWEKVIHENQPILILEDDAVLSHRIKDLLSELRNLNDVDRVNLESRIKKKVVSNKHQSIGDHKIMRTFVDRSGAAGYVLYPSGAQKLLRKYHAQVALADKIDRNQSLKSFQVEPSAVLPLDFCHRWGVQIEGSEAKRSTIDQFGTHSDERSLSARIRCRVRRVFAEARLIVPLCAGLLRGQRRLIAVQKEDFTTFDAA